jgi:hypothetical protein
MGREISLIPPLRPLKTSLLLVTSSVKQVGISIGAHWVKCPERELGHLLGHHHCPVLRWYILTCLKWSESLPRFVWWFLLPRSRCLGAHPATPFAWRLWASWLQNSKKWRNNSHGLSGLSRGSMSCSLGHHLIGPDWPMVWTRPLDILEQRWLYGRR